MNSQFLTLSSTNTDQTITVANVNLIDYTLLTISLSGVTERLLPAYLSINWGDGDDDFFENDILQSDNIASNIFSSILNDTYSHEYFPSNVSTVQALTASFSIHYINSDTSTFIIPLSVTNYDYDTAVGDVKLINTDFLQSGDKIHQLVTDEGGYLVELRVK